MFKTLTTLVIASIIVHSVIGLWTVGTDYLTPRTLGFISSRLGGYANHLRLMYQLFFVTLSVTLVLYNFISNLVVIKMVGHLNKDNIQTLEFDALIVGGGGSGMRLP